MITFIVAPQVSIDTLNAPPASIRSGIVLDIGRVIKCWHADPNGHIYAYIHPLGKTLVGTDETQLAAQIALIFSERSNQRITAKQGVINKLKEKYGDRAAGPAASTQDLSE